MPLRDSNLIWFLSGQTCHLSILCCCIVFWWKSLGPARFFFFVGDLLFWRYLGRLFFFPLGSLTTSPGYAVLLLILFSVELFHVQVNSSFTSGELSAIISKYFFCPTFWVIYFIDSFPYVLTFFFRSSFFLIMWVAFPWWFSQLFPLLNYPARFCSRAFQFLILFLSFAVSLFHPPVLSYSLGGGGGEFLLYWLCSFIKFVYSVKYSSGVWFCFISSPVFFQTGVFSVVPSLYYISFWLACI